MHRRELLGGLLGASLVGCERRASSDGSVAIEADPTPARVAAVERLRILSYNVLADPVAVERRIPALLRAIERTRPDVLALQEVAPWFLDWLADTSWLRGFEIATIDGVVARPNGQLIVSRFPIHATRSRTLPGVQGRTVLIAQLELGPDQRVAVATTHMESLLEDGPVRAAQLEVIFAELARERDDPRVVATVLAGDLNFGDGEQPDTAALDPAFVDLWAALRPGEPGYTWDIERSEMARAGSFVGEPSRRLDRILVRARAWVPASIEILGDQPVEPGERGLFPSDHFGLIGELVAKRTAGDRPAAARATGGRWP